MRTPGTRSRIAGPGPVTVLDVGAGAGTYANLLAGTGVTHLTALEVFELSGTGLVGTGL